MILCPKLLPVTTEYQNDWFSVKKRGEYYTFEPNSLQVATLVVVGKKVLLVKVKRPVINDETWELPAGGCLPDETPEQAAVRELTEEAGIFVDQNRLLSLQAPSICPNRYAESMYVFGVEITEAEWQHRADFDSEIADVALFTLAKIQAMLLKNEIYVALPSLMLAKLLLAPNNDIKALQLKAS